jgi:hypothetical protein
MEVLTIEDMQPLFSEMDRLNRALHDLRKQQAETLYELKTSVLKPLSMPISEAARFRGCSVTHLRAMIKAGYIKPVYIGHSGVNIATKDLENLPDILLMYKKNKHLKAS